MERYPLYLIPVSKENLWGGRRLKDAYGKTAPFEKLAESWELTVRPDGMCRIGNGTYSGMTLGEYLASSPDAVSPRWEGGRFPLLIKYIDARDRLSVQVHPDDEYARMHEGDAGKTELWHILEAGPEASLVYGLRAGTTVGAFSVTPYRKNALRNSFIRYLSAPGRRISFPRGSCTPSVRGSPSWTKLVNDVADKVRALDEKDHVFAAIESCDMEFNFENDIVAGFGRLEKAGCDSVVVVPAFIYPTSHVQFDVVTILGLYGDPKAREAAREENARILRTKLPIALTPTLSAGDLLKNYAVDQAKSAMQDPANERVLFVAHGDDDYAGLVDAQTKSAVDAVAELGFDAVDTAYVGMGAEFANRAKPVIEKNTKDGKKTIVVALYLASGSKKFLERVQKFPVADENAPSPSLEGLNYVGTETALGEFDGTPKYIYDVAVETSKN